ncbi:E motif [Dillenia turbinata]|uniref:E motif n=1 Tax=Dillenia turbinata TaxID=194707 RepID=A0AAN8ZK83_9MAGN
MYCKCGNTYEAHCVSSFMVDKDAVSWRTLIGGYSMNCCSSGGLHLYLTMKSSGLKTNPVMGTSFLPMLAKLRLVKQGKEMHRYILWQGFEHIICLVSALIDLYVRCGMTTKATHVFENMSRRDITTWNTMVAGHAYHGDTDSTFSVFLRIWKSKLRPNFVIQPSIIPVCARIGILKKGKEIHGYAIRSNTISEVAVRNTLIDLYSKCGSLDLGVRAFNEVREKNIVTAGHIDDACNFITRMPVEPKIDVLGSLLGACKVHKQEELSVLVKKHILQKNGRDWGHYILLYNILASLWEDSQKIRTAIHKQGLKKKPGKSWIQVHQFCASACICNPLMDYKDVERERMKFIALLALG